LGAKVGKKRGSSSHSASVDLVSQDEDLYLELHVSLSANWSPVYRMQMVPLHIDRVQILEAKLSDAQLEIERLNGEVEALKASSVSTIEKAQDLTAKVAALTASTHDTTTKLQTAANGIRTDVEHLLTAHQPCLLLLGKVNENPTNRSMYSSYSSTTNILNSGNNRAVKTFSDVVVGNSFVQVTKDGIYAIEYHAQASSTTKCCLLINSAGLNRTNSDYKYVVSTIQCLKANDKITVDYSSSSSIVNDVFMMTKLSSI
jgi:hypothetical protein